MAKVGFNILANAKHNPQKLQYASKIQEIWSHWSRVSNKIGCFVKKLLS